MCKYPTFFVIFFGKRKSLGRSNEAKRSKTGNSPGGQNKNATPTIANEDLRQTSNWSKLVAAYLPVARLTILDRLVCIKVQICHIDISKCPIKSSTGTSCMGTYIVPG